MTVKTSLTSPQNKELLKTLEERFKKHPERHEGLAWEKVRNRLLAHPEKLLSLYAMEQSGGEPDVIALRADENLYRFYDCSPETPKGRRKTCYDREGLKSRKEPKPDTNAVDMASAMGIELLTETQYRELQSLGTFDTKTSSWIKTPEEVRNLGGALFADFRYGQVFIYHNGAQSYYSSRGFRGLLRV